MDWLSILPPILAVVIAVWKREVILSLGLALFSAELLLAGFNPLAGFTGTLDRLSAVFTSPGNTAILLLSLLIGTLLAFMRNSGGVNAFVDLLLAKRLARSARSSGMLTAGLGVGIFIETYISILATGIFAQSLFDRFGLSRARLAYIIDSTSSPVSVLILLNGWGAYILGLLDGYGLENPLAVMVASIPLNFYAILTLLVVLYTCWTTRAHFTLAAHEDSRPVHTAAASEHPTGKVRFFLVPLGVLIAAFIGFMLKTGGGSLLAGNGSVSLLYAFMLAILAATLLLLLEPGHTWKSLLDTGYKGMAEMLPVTTIMLLAFALGSSMQALGTGPFMAGMVSAALPLWLVAPMLFITAGVVSVTTGTSWGTYGILIPVAIPMAQLTGLPVELLLAAVLGGGVFGDHCSPISDSTVLASLAAGCDHLDHVRTQLPYALLTGLLSLPLLVLFSL